jgi:hypothetical protein
MRPTTSALRTEDMSKLQATMVFIRNALTQDLDESLYPVPLSVNNEWCDEPESVNTAEANVRGSEEV